MPDNEPKILELQLAGWQKSDSSGRAPMVKFFLQSDEDVEFFEQFTVTKGTGKKQITGQIFDAAIQISDQDEQSGVDLSQATPVEPEKGEWGRFAHLLHRNGFFRAKPVWQALGTDEDYQAWTRLQPCIISGDYDYAELTPGGGLEPRCEYCHVRRSGEAGTSYKPEYSGVPMKHEYHMKQHNDGESVLGTREWFDKKAMENIERWAHETFVKVFICDSLTDVHPRLIQDWALENSLFNFLPREIKEWKP